MAKKYQQKGGRINVDRDKPIAGLRHSFMTISVGSSWELSNRDVLEEQPFFMAKDPADIWNWLKELP